MFFIRRACIGSTLQQSSQVSKFAITICSLPSLYYYSITTDSCCKCETDDYKKKQIDIPLLLKCTNVSTTSDKGILHQHQTSILASSPTAVSKPIKHKWWKFKWWQKNTKQQYNTSIEKQSSWWNRIGKTFFVITRGIEITIRLCPLIVMTPTAMLVSRCFRESTWVSDISWGYTLHTLQCLGPAFVKLGQWAATRRDLFPVHVCIRLSELQDTARVHDWKYTHQSLCEAFGQDYESSGLVVSKDSILGSGSVGQVHRGTLQSNDIRRPQIDVAIKVLHPNTKQLVQRDLALMAYIAEFIDKMIPLNIVKMLSLPRAVTNFSNVIERQVDLRVEGDNLQVFRHNFDCSDSNKRPQSITFPNPEPDWISEKVLVEEYAGDDAVPIARYLSDNSQEGLKIRKKLAGPLLRGFLKMVFTDNFIHADLHPG